MEESLARIDAAAVAFFQHHSAEAHALLLSIELDVPLFSQMLVVRLLQHAHVGCGLGSWLCALHGWHGCVYCMVSMAVFCILARLCFAALTLSSESHSCISASLF